MPSFGARSKSNLVTCEEPLQRIFFEVVQHFDCTVLGGRRSKHDQDEKYRQGLSKVKWPNSKHNCPDPDDPDKEAGPEVKSRAVDVAPYPIDWEDRDRFHYFAGYVMGVAASMGIKLRWGGDWDRDTQTKDNRFDDLPHFELVE